MYRTIRYALKTDKLCHINVCKPQMAYSGGNVSALPFLLCHGSLPTACATHYDVGGCLVHALLGTKHVSSTLPAFEFSSKRCVTAHAVTVISSKAQICWILIVLGLCTLPLAWCGKDWKADVGPAPLCDNSRDRYVRGDDSVRPLLVLDADPAHQVVDSVEGCANVARLTRV